MMRPIWVVLCMFPFLPAQFGLANWSHGTFGSPLGIGPLNGLRLAAPSTQQSAAFLTAFCQPSQSGKRMTMPSAVLSSAQLDLLCRRLGRLPSDINFGAGVRRQGRAGARLFPEEVDRRMMFEEDGQWAEQMAMAPMAEKKRAYDYIRFGRRSAPDGADKKLLRAAHKKAANRGGNTYDYIRFGR